MEINIITQNKKTVVEFDGKINLADAIRSSGVMFSFSCGGMGRCHGCTVSVVGKINESSDEEIALFGENSLKRLACKTVCYGDTDVYISQNEKIKGESSLAAGDFTFNRTMSNAKIGAVVDIGSTTIQSFLFDIMTGRLVKSSINLNRQTMFGSDVLSRIEYEMRTGNGNLSKILREQLDEILSDFGEFDLAVFTGNTTELYTYFGLDLSPLSAYPFDITEKFGRFVDKSLYIPPVVSSFVGADIVCGILSCGMLNVERAVFLDLGTNGEIVYKNGEDFYCCSTAVGPVFEGAGIECGFPATDGSIDSVYGIGNRISYTVIGGTEAKKIAGSGVIDAVACFLRCGYIESDGYLAENTYIADSDVYITPSDVRGVQLAKAAVHTALETVCEDLSAVDMFFVSGGFGDKIDIKNAVQIGLFPREMSGKTTFVKNAAATGASMILFDEKNQERCEKIAEKCKTVYLANDDNFQRKFLENMNF